MSSDPPCRLLPRSGAASFWDWTAPLPLPPPSLDPRITTPPCRHPPAPSPPHTTQHTSRCRAPEACVGSSFPLGSVPSKPSHLYTCPPGQS